MFHPFDLALPAAQSVTKSVFMVQTPYLCSEFDCLIGSTIDYTKTSGVGFYLIQGKIQKVPDQYSIQYIQYSIYTASLESMGCMSDRSRVLGPIFYLYVHCSG